MSLYKHAANKGELLDAMVDAVLTEIVRPAPSSTSITWSTARSRPTGSPRGNAGSGLLQPGENGAPHLRHAERRGPAIDVGRVDLVATGPENAGDVS